MDEKVAKNYEDIAGDKEKLLIEFSSKMSTKRLE